MTFGKKIPILLIHYLVKNTFLMTRNVFVMITTASLMACREENIQKGDYQK